MGRRVLLAAVAWAFGLSALSGAVAAPGQLDGGFANAGKALTDLGGLDFASSVAIGPRSTVVVAGGNGGDVAVVRYDVSGRLDQSFGGRGTVLTDLGGLDAAARVVVQRDGKIVVAGERDGRIFLARYLVNGTLDPSFGREGTVVADSGGQDRAVGLLVRSDGRVVVVAGKPDGLMLARYLRDGRVDASFGRGGSVSRATPGIEWRSATTARDGAIVVAGARVAAGHDQGMAIAVARYRADGRPDRALAGNGLKVTRRLPHWAGALHVAVRPDGRMVFGAHGHAGSVAGFALLQLRSNGSFDPRFGRGGIAVAPVGFGVHALALDRRGRIVTAGRTTSLRDVVVARFLSDGRRDRSFAQTVTDFGGTDTPFWLTLQPDGKIVVAGASAASGLLGNIAVARYLASG
jgi:uncharacterized delta-60 repeat protein